MITLGVLVSGTGSNLQAIVDAIEGNALDARIAVVISNVVAAPALDRARDAGIEALVVDHRLFADRRSFDARLVEVLRARDVDFVVLAGFMRLLTDVMIDAFPMRIVNVHPALLPAFPGIHAPSQALAYGVRVAGCTVHFVDLGTDTGPIIAQAAVPVMDDDDEESLRVRILAREHELLPRVLQWIAEDRVSVEPAAEGRFETTGDTIPVAAASAASGARGRRRVRLRGVLGWRGVEPG